ncbi:MAG: hypothetical protein ACYDB9_10425 [Gammaproteobacteria bacterium]
MADIDRQKIKADGWRQGSCFTKSSCPGLIQALPAEHKIEGAIYICVTHDCSVLSPRLAVEPHIEYLIALPAEKLDGNCTYGKNIRKLHLNIVVDGDQKPYELLAYRRGFMPRELIVGTKPAGNIKLETEQKGLLARWLANRYTATAFPDAFEIRIAKVREKLKKHLENPLAHQMLGIWIALLPGMIELLASDKYEVVISLVYTADAYEKDLVEQKLDDFADKMKDIIGEADGIVVAGVVVISEKDFSLMNYRKMLRWVNFEYISMKSDEDDIVVIEDK